MVDLREKVEDDRGLIKKIQLAIPGYRGYRQKEDLRIADRLLREQLADGLGIAVRDLERSRDNLVEAKELDLLEKASKLINQAQAAENRLRHAEQGYTGISPDYRIQQAQLNQMYEWDLGLIYNIDNVKGAAENLKGATASNDKAGIDKAIDFAMDSLEKFDEIFSKRREALAGLIVTEG